MTGKKACMVITLCMSLSVLYAPSAFAADSYLEMREGEQLLLPDRGEITIEDESIVKTGADGNVEALGEGETEITVKYRIRVSKPGKQESTEVPSEDQTEGNHTETSQMIHGENIESAEYEETGEREENDIPEEEQQDTAIKDVLIQEQKKETVEIFIPDFISPEILLENLPKSASNNTPVAPVLLIRDENPQRDTIQIILEGKRTGIRTPEYRMEIQDKEIKVYLEKLMEDDEYTLICTAGDAYGNISKGKWFFTVNQQGTGFICFGEEHIMEKGLAPEIVLENMDAVEVLSCMVNGENVSFTWENGRIQIPRENLKNGKNRISVIVQDMAGNITQMDPWDFILEKEENTEDGAGEEEQETVRMQRESPIGIIFLLIGSVLVFWEKKMWYNSEYRKNKLV